MRERRVFNKRQTPQPHRRHVQKQKLIVNKIATNIIICHLKHHSLYFIKSESMVARIYDPVQNVLGSFLSFQSL